MVWALFLNAEGLFVRLATVAFLGLIGWPFTVGTLHAVAGLFLLTPNQYKVEAFDKAVITFERDWREQYWTSFWDSIALLPYHLEPRNDFPKVRLGFLDHWRICDGNLFIVMDGKRRVGHIVPEGSGQFELKAAHKASNSRGFYGADLMCIISPSGFAQEAIEYFKDHPNQFLLQVGEEATQLANLLNTGGKVVPEVLLDSFETVRNLSKLADLATATRDDVDKAMKTASEIVGAYGAVLEQARERRMHLHPESDLPFSKAQIRQSIELLLLFPTDDNRRNTLECSDILLNDFVPDDDYRVVKQQRSGLGQAVKNWYRSEQDIDQFIKATRQDRDQIIKTIREGTTQEGEARLQEIEERVSRDNQRTTERHKELRLEAARLRKSD